MLMDIDFAWASTMDVALYVELALLGGWVGARAGGGGGGRMAGCCLWHLLHLVQKLRCPVWCSR